MSDDSPMFPPFNWLKEADIYNKNNQKISYEWLSENADVVVVLFTANGVDRDGIIQKFYEIYENAKFGNLPIEVIYTPMDETERDMEACYDCQANWFTLKFDDTLVPTLQWMYGITSLPQLYVIKIDGSVISSHGNLDIERYGKNALLTWLSTAATTKTHRRMSKDTIMYGPKWNYMNLGTKYDYHKRFSPVAGSDADTEKHS